MFIMNFNEFYDYINQNVYTTIKFIFIRESYIYYNDVFKNKNVLYILHDIYFYENVMSLQILKVTVYL